MATDTIAEFIAHAGSESESPHQQFGCNLCRGASAADELSVGGGVLRADAAVWIASSIVATGKAPGPEHSVEGEVILRGDSDSTVS